MPVSITFDPNITTPQERVLNNANASMDGLMTPLMLAQLDALWAASGNPDPVVVDRTMRLRVTPSVTMPFGALVPNASPTNNGVVSKAMAQSIAALFAASMLPTPSVPNAPPTRVRYQFSLQFTEVTIPQATDRSNGLMTALQAARLAILAIPPPSYASVVAADNPLLWWRLNTAPFNAGPVVDASGNGNTGTLNVFVPSVSPGLVHGDANVPTVASSGRSILCNTLDLTGRTAASMEFWIKPNPGQTAFFFMGGNLSSGGVLCGINSMLQLEFAVVATDGSTGALLALPGSVVVGTRYYIAFTYDDTINAGHLYSNGVLVASALGTMRPSGGFDTGVQEFQVANLLFGPQWFSQLQEIAEYGTALSGARILAHYNAGK
jgi:hypothetical protein